MRTKNFEERLKRNSGEFSRIVPYENTDRLLQMDFTENNNELTAQMLEDTELFTRYINKKLEKANARYGIGGYGEHRTIYSRSKVFDAPPDVGGAGSEPRRLHLGVDIWGRPHTKVMAPLDGIVHSFSFRNFFGDYGTVIILTHSLEELSFHTLYGHLSLNSIKNMSEGERIKKGEVFADFGIPQENGYWPPHLHFQIILDLEGMKGDYPGVCRFSERERYLENCPDPDLILRMNDESVIVNSE